MEQSVISYNPILILVSIVISMIATYTALDLFLQIKKSERNNQFYFLGGTFSIGIGIWAMHFISMLSMKFQMHVSYEMPITILSMISGIIFTGLAFLVITRNTMSVFRLVLGSILMTVAVLSMHFIGMNAMNMSIQYEGIIFTLAALLIFGAFLFTFWILFYSRNFSSSRQLWFKPLSALIIAASTVEAHFLLIKGSHFNMSEAEWMQSIQSTETFIVYLVLSVSVLILGGLIISSTIMNKRLAYSDTYLKDIQSALDESSIVAITNPQGEITYVNEKFCEISKYEEHELLGQDHRILNSGYHPPEFFKALWRTIGQGKVWKGEIRNKAKDGSFYWVHTTIVPFLNKKGKPYQYVSIRTDITDRKNGEVYLKNSLKEVKDYKFALDQSSIVAITNEKGMITNVNDKFCEISKYDREELIGQDHRILNSGYHSKEFFKSLWKTIGQGDVWKGEIRNKAKDGSYYWVDTTIVPFMNENGKPYQYVAIRNDITERKQSEEMLHRQDKLAAVGQLAAGVAHEIRNPLTSMRGYAEFLQLDETDESRLEYLDIILDEITRVNSIVEEFMVLAKPKPESELKVKNIVPIIENVLSLVEFDARKKHVRLHFDAKDQNIHVECDENRLKQVFLNFVKNGIEAMPAGGDIHVRTDKKNDNVHISIRDTGVGIPPEKLKKLGEPFYTTKENGNGLGLMVSFKIIENHNGKIFVESELNKGTTFNILLPSQTAS